MPDYIESFGQAFNRLKTMRNKVLDDSQVAIFLASFDDKKNSSIGLFFASLHTRAGMLNRKTVTSVHIQEYEEQVM